MACRGACPVIWKPLKPVAIVTKDAASKLRPPRIKADDVDVRFLLDTLGLPRNRTLTDIVCKLQMKMADSNRLYINIKNLAKDVGVESFGDMDEGMSSIACKLKEKFVAIETDYLAVKKNLKKSRSKVRRRDDKIKTLRQQVEEAEKSTSKREEKLILERETVNSLNSDIERMKIQHSDDSNDVNKLKKQYQGATKILDDYKAQLEATQAQNQNGTIRIAELQEEVTQSKLEKEQFQSQIKAMEIKISKIEMDAIEGMEEEKNRSDKIKKEMMAKTEHWSRKADVMKKLVNQLEKSLSKLEAENEQYQHQLQISSDNLTETSKSLQDYQEKHFETLQENTGLRSRVKSLEIDRHKLEDEMKELKGTTSRAVKINEELMAQLSSVDQECLNMKVELDKRNQEIDSLLKLREESDSEKEHLFNELKTFRQLLTAAGLSTGIITSVDHEIDIGMIVQSYEEMKERCNRLQQSANDLKNSKLLSSENVDGVSSPSCVSTGSGLLKEEGSASAIEAIKFKTKTQSLMIAKLRYYISKYQQNAMSDIGSSDTTDIPVVDRAVMSLIPLEDIPTIMTSQLEAWDTDDSKLIGKGTFGEVFLKRLGPHPVAFKLQGVKEHRKVNKEGMKRLASLNHFRTMKEVAVHQLLGAHPTFPRCYGYTSHANYPGMVVDFLGDKDTGVVYPLSKAIKTKTPALSDQEWLDIVVDITEGVHAMHERDLLHNDIKPNNVLLQKDDRWKAYIIDMGNVTTVTMPHKNRNITDHEMEGYKLGVVYQHLAPEYILEGEYSSIQSDIFSLGRILHYVSRVTHNSDLFNLAALMIDRHPHLRPSWQEINRVIKAFKNRRTSN